MPDVGAGHARETQHQIQSHVGWVERSAAEPNIKTKTAGGSPAASHFLLRRQKKVTQEKATPVCRRCAVPCVARLVRRLRNSHDPLRGHVLKQSSPKSPDQSPLLSGAQGMKSKIPKP
jgi:hypothetical protein